MPRTLTRHKVRRKIDWLDVARFAREQWPREFPCPIAPPELRRWRTLQSEARAAATFWNDKGGAWHDVIRPAYEAAIAEGRRASA